MAAHEILVTGATGYLGARCAAKLELAGLHVRRGCRTLPLNEHGARWVSYGDLASPTELAAALSGCDTVLHFAGEAHVRETAKHILTARQSNVVGTVALARAAISAGVQRFIFISSVLVLAGARDAHGIVRDTTPVRPLTAYGEIKADAERGLLEVASGSCMNVIILRPPMVYGPGAPGNFGRLVKLVASGLPLPLARAHGAKSFLFVDNLLSAVQATLDYRGPLAGSYLLADREVTSTADLLRRIGRQLGRRPILFPVPEWGCRVIAKATGHGRVAESLFSPLVLDSSGFSADLGWQPPVTLEAGIAATVNSFRDTRAR
jgi:nucleoside-diphosphate-sugar epimerase